MPTSPAPTSPARDRLATTRPATTRPATSRTALTRTAPTGPAARLQAVPDPALDEALERISELAARLWAVRSAHRPVVAGWRRREARCAECGQALPCATLRAAG